MRKGTYKGKAALLIALALSVTCGCGTLQNMPKGEETMDSVFTNPIKSVQKDIWQDYGVGDPFVMRYDGMYYLYSSTRDTEVGIKCFSSMDLVNWNYEGLCTEEEVSKCAYAPEVVYYNGMFYMYTSPAGRGHYVLESNSPTGPFKLITDNLGMSIDGSVFIDDDGSWYFYHAGDNGIEAHTMTSPKDMSDTSLLVNAYMNGWTEGPMVIKHNGEYYLTYTGNHVLSDGYRINCAIGDSPLYFTPQENNPVIVHTMGNIRGIGHSSTVKAPNLDGYYMIYHTLTGRAKEGYPTRDMNIAKITFINGGIGVTTPTEAEQSAPSMPKLMLYPNDDFSNEWKCKNVSNKGGRLEIKDGGTILSELTLDKDFTAEYNLSSLDKAGTVGGYFSYNDAKNYGAFYVDLATKTVKVSIVSNGIETQVEYVIPKSFDEEVDFSANQSFQIEVIEGKGQIFFNDRLLGSFDCGLNGGSIGYFSKGATAKCGFIGGSNAAGDPSKDMLAQNIPGKVYPDDGKLVVRAEVEGDYHIVLNYRSLSDGTLKSIEKEPMHLAKGVQDLVLSTEDGSYVESVYAWLSEEITETDLTFDSVGDDNVYGDGEWKIKNGSLFLKGMGKFSGKRLYGKENWCDYTVEADIRIESTPSDAGILIRTTNPAIGGAGNDAELGIDFVQGYFVSIKDDAIVLEKMNYGKKELARKELTESIPEGDSILLSVTANHQTISVSLNGEEILEYTDESEPFMNGMAGVLTRKTSFYVDRFSVIKD